MADAHSPSYSAHWGRRISQVQGFRNRLSSFCCCCFCLFLHFIIEFQHAHARTHTPQPWIISSCTCPLPPTMINSEPVLFSLHTQLQPSLFTKLLESCPIYHISRRHFHKTRSHFHNHNPIIKLTMASLPNLIRYPVFKFITHNLQISKFSHNFLNGWFHWIRIQLGGNIYIRRCA